MEKIIFQDFCISGTNSKKKKNPEKIIQSVSFFRKLKILKKREENKKIFYKIVKNEGGKKELESLWTLKELFQKQLPNIPKTYITRLLFEKNHESIIIKKYKKKKSQIIGGCSFRLFKRQQVIELVFFAIKTKKQTQGYGTYLILLLKEYARFLGYKHIITCADNNAMNFFFYQGFSPTITLPSLFWVGFLKDYEDVVLMEFLIFTRFNFFNFLYLSYFLTSSVIRSFRFKKNLLKSFFYPKKKEKKNVFFFKKKILELSSIFEFKKEMNKIFNKIKFKDFIFPFLEPTKKVNLFDKNYFKKVFNAKDLRTIEEKLRFNHYKSWSLFLKDLEKIIKNCNLYNGLKHLTSDGTKNFEIFLEKLKRKLLTKSTIEET